MSEFSFMSVLRISKTERRIVDVAGAADRALIHKGCQASVR